MSSKDLMRKFSESEDLSYMQAMVADGTIKDVNKPYDEDGYTALIYQCYYRKKEVLERVRFLFLGCHPPAKPNIKDKYGFTCLHWAVDNYKGGDDPMGS